MMIMTLAYAQRKNDNAYLAQHYDILKQWNNYLVNDSLIPASQISTDVSQRRAVMVHKLGNTR